MQNNIRRYLGVNRYVLSGDKKRDRHARYRQGDGFCPQNPALINILYGTRKRRERVDITVGVDGECDEYNRVEMSCHNIAPSSFGRNRDQGKKGGV